MLILSKISLFSFNCNYKYKDTTFQTSYNTYLFKTMKKSLFLLVCLFSVLTFGCCDSVSNNCESDSNLGLFDAYRPPFLQIGSINLGSETDIRLKVLWTDGCIFESYLDVVKQDDLTYKFILKNRSKGCACTDDIRQGTVPFKFKPSKTGEHKLIFIDRKDTIETYLNVN